MEIILITFAGTFMVVSTVFSFAIKKAEKVMEQDMQNKKGEKE